MEIATSTSSLFLPTTRPLRDSSASLSFFKRTCFSKLATSLCLACSSKNESVSIIKKNKNKFYNYTSSDNLAAAARPFSNLLARSRTDKRFCCSNNWAVSLAMTSFINFPSSFPVL
ncbi:hypothetical protein HanIR_Chr06g0291851 [Helianthus annuus]|nr:hypothetical protein HanIR_Chr06g0291851 [Helianthus annuus]